MATGGPTRVERLELAHHGAHVRVVLIVQGGCLQLLLRDVVVREDLPLHVAQNVLEEYAVPGHWRTGKRRRYQES
jgi:hypothetical protein